MPDHMTVRVGVSSCLLGQKVRFDGGHKRDAFLVDTFGEFVEWVPVCPELEVGMGLPREAIRLVRSGAGIRLVGVKSATDHTESMTAVLGAAGGEARPREPRRLHPEEGLAQLRDGAGEGLRPERIAGADGPRPVRGGAHGAVPAAARGRGGAAVGPAAARQLRRAGVRVPAPARGVRRAVDDRRPREVPHGPQAHAARAFPRRLQGARPAGGARGGTAAGRGAGRLRGGLHARHGHDRHAAEARERPAAHARVLPGRAGRRLEGGAGAVDCRLPEGPPAARRAGHAVPPPRRDGAGFRISPARRTWSRTRRN